MKIYGSSFSPYARKVIAYCIEAGIDHELVSIGLGSPDPGFQAASPLGKMPAMEDDGFTLADSSAIIHYLEARHQPGLIPQDPQGLGKAVWWDEVADAELFGALQPAFFNRIVLPLFQRREGDMAAADRAMAGPVPKILDWLEAHMPEGDGWLLGERLTLADIAIASPLVNLRHAGGTLDAHPRIAAFAERLHARPCFASSIAWEERALAKIRG
ncbi:MAG: glutathione S-transferase family protein [Novosphingopyxis baekryungensis]|jgi:glutathione S-transferase|nr:glutathione S-transferase family protein [Novosphingopyxis baekryungensis]